MEIFWKIRTKKILILNEFLIGWDFLEKGASQFLVNMFLICETLLDKKLFSWTCYFFITMGCLCLVPSNCWVVHSNRLFLTCLFLFWKSFLIIRNIANDFHKIIYLYREKISATQIGQRLPPLLPFHSFTNSSTPSPILFKPIPSPYRYPRTKTSSPLMEKSRTPPVAKSFQSLAMEHDDTVHISKSPAFLLYTDSE